MPLTLTPLQHIPFIRRDENLADIIVASLHETNIELQDNDILVVAQKIVSKAEGRTVNLVNVTPSQRAIELAQQTEKDPRVVELMLQESNEVLRTRVGTIIVEHRLGFVCANAGIDHSNVAGLGNSAEEWVLLLPLEPDKSAEKMRSEIRLKTGRNVGVLIIDSHGRAWRNGVLGSTIGLSGMPALVDMRGQEDMYHYALRVTTIGAADELAAGASLMMGQAAEGTPVVIARGFPYVLREGSASELVRNPQFDMFR